MTIYILSLIFYTIIGLFLNQLLLIQGQTSQPNVLSDGKRHGLYLWIHFKSGTKMESVIKSIAEIQQYANEVCSTPGCSPGDEVLAGVGFGAEFYEQLTNSTNRSFTLSDRKGQFGELPSTGGDIFVHGKSNNFGKLFEFVQIVQKNLPPDALASFSDTYGFTYKEGRDLSGFVDGTENPSSRDRMNFAIDSNGGSYCITQEWIHNMDFINREKASNLEGFVGRKINDSAELLNKSSTSHVARMTSGEQFKAPKVFQMYRQSMPYGKLSGIAGLFFIGFASSPSAFDYFLNRMVGSTSDGLNDDIMKLSNCISGNYWYFPSLEELNRLQNANFNGAQYRTTRQPNSNNRPGKYSGGESYVPSSSSNRQTHPGRSSATGANDIKISVSRFFLVLNTIVLTLLTLKF